MDTRDGTAMLTAGIRLDVWLSEQAEVLERRIANASPVPTAEEVREDRLLMLMTLRKMSAYVSMSMETSFHHIAPWRTWWKLWLRHRLWRWLK